MNRSLLALFESTNLPKEVCELILEINRKEFEFIRISFSNKFSAKLQNKYRYLLYNKLMLEEYNYIDFGRHMCFSSVNKCFVKIMHSVDVRLYSLEEFKKKFHKIYLILGFFPKFLMDKWFIPLLNGFRIYS